MEGTNKRFKRKDAYTAMFTISQLNSPEVCMTQTQEQSSTNRGYHKKEASNRGMEHGCACKVTRIKEHIEFASICIVNSESIKREGSSFF